MGAEKFITAPQVMAGLFEKHPEIIQIAVAAYIPHRHGTRATDIYQQFIPVSEEIPGMAEGHWRRTNLDINEVVAVGSTVTVCHRENCGHSFGEHDNDQTQLWYLWHEGWVTSPEGPQKSFIFLDLEPGRPEVLEKSVDALEDLDRDWYILNSGRGFHVVLDKLVDFFETPSEYGKIIALFGDKTGDELLAKWGEYLKSGNDPWTVFSWCNFVLKLCGHPGEKLRGYRRGAHMVDLRHIAHGLQGFQRYSKWLRDHPFDPTFHRQYSCPEEIGGVYLRIAPKRKGEMPPVLVAQKEGQEITLFDSYGL